MKLVVETQQLTEQDGNGSRTQPLQGCEVGSCTGCGRLAKVVRTTNDVGQEVIICLCPTCLWI